MGQPTQGEAAESGGRKGSRDKGSSGNREGSFRGGRSEAVKDGEKHCKRKRQEGGKERERASVWNNKVEQVERRRKRGLLTTSHRSGTLGLAAPPSPPSSALLCS